MVVAKWQATASRVCCLALWRDGTGQARGKRTSTCCCTETAKQSRQQRGSRAHRLDCCCGRRGAAPQPCCLAYMVLLPASGRPASNCGFLTIQAGRSCRCTQAWRSCRAACAVCKRPRTLPRGSWCSRFQRPWPCLLATTCCTVRCAAPRIRLLGLLHTLVRVAVFHPAAVGAPSLLSLPGVFLQPCAF